jgi:hypothetical protein
MTLFSHYRDCQLSFSNKSVIALSLVSIWIMQFCCWCSPVLAYSELAEPSMKKPPMVPEQSVSCYVPSESAPGKGLAVNIIYAKLPRYPDGAPVAVIAPGGAGADGLGFEMHAAQAGFIEVRFAFPGGGHGKFLSSGIYDNRGPESQMALRDVLLFAAGKIASSDGQKIYELVPIKVSSTNIGLVGWSNGGNIALVTMYKFAEQLSFIGWIAFYESPLGSMFFPPNLGGEHDLVINKHYRQGSCATGDCLINYNDLTFDPFFQRNAGERKKIGDIEIPGVLYFDENHNGIWDESIEYAFSYATDVGLEKQIYPPDLTAALELQPTFIRQVTINSKKRKGGPPVPTGFIGLFDKGDPSNPPVDPLATPRKVPSLSATEATDKWAYTWGVPGNAPVSARNRKYYFRPLPPGFEEDENGQLVSLAAKARAKEEDAKEKARAIAKVKAKKAKLRAAEEKAALALNPDAVPAESNDDKAVEEASPVKSRKAASEDDSTSDEQVLRGIKKQTKLAIESVKNDSSKIDKRAMTDETGVVARKVVDDVETTNGAAIADDQGKLGARNEVMTGDNAATKDDAPTDDSAASAPDQTPAESTPATPKAPVVKAPKAAKVAGGPSLRQKFRFGSLPKKAPDDSFQKLMLVWPDSIATLKESEAYFEERDGSLYIAKIIEKFPNLLVMVFGSEVDHLQRQLDHPHIALNYNAWLSNKAKWVRLNPDQYYMAAAAQMNKGNFKNNPPKSPIDASEMNIFLESEGIVPDYVFMDGCIAELADRLRTKNLRGNLTDVLVQYNNGAAPPPVTLKDKPKLAK